MSKEIGREKGFDTQVENASELLKKGEILFQRGLDSDGNPDGGRWGMQVSLHAALDLMETLGVASSTQKPLNRLLMGLKDLENGTVPTFLKVNRTRRGAPPRTADELLFQRHSVLLYMFIEQDKSITKLQARQDTVRLLQKQGFQLSPKPDVRDDNVLKSWIRNHRKTDELSQLRGLYVKLIGIEARPMDKARKLAKQLPEIISTGVYRKPQRK